MRQSPYHPHYGPSKSSDPFFVGRAVFLLHHRPSKEDVWLAVCSRGPGGPGHWPTKPARPRCRSGHAMRNTPILFTDEAAELGGSYMNLPVTAQNADGYGYTRSWTRRDAAPYVAGYRRAVELGFIDPDTRELFPKFDEMAEDWKRL